MIISIVIFGMILLILSIFDYKIKAIPSAFITAFLLTSIVLNPANIWIGLISFVMAYLLYELDYFGIAGIKVMTMMGFLVTYFNDLILMLILIVIFGTTWKVILKLRKNDNPAFIPVFLFVYIAMILLGVF